MKIADNSIGSIIQFFNKELKEVYNPSEIEVLFKWCAEKFSGIQPAYALSDIKSTLNESELLKYFDAVKRLKGNEPIQYVLGETEFYRLKFKVNKQVLIPRPETEELVDFILKENYELRTNNYELLDIGTGSGCIPISIKKNRPNWNVSALDISREALKVAEENAEKNGVNINLILKDIFQLVNPLPQHSNIPFPKFNIIVSNPPYVLKKETKEMSANVLAHEPHLALFVEDDDPLLFYKAIVRYAKMYLKPGGKLYFEINEKMGEEVKGLLLEHKFTDVEVVKDILGKNRIVMGKI